MPIKGYQKEKSRKGLFVVLICILFAFLSGLLIGRAGVTEALSPGAVTKKVLGIGSKAPADVLEEEIEFKQFWELWKILKLKYYEDASEEKMFYGAMKGLAESLEDPYTSFFEPELAKEFTDSLKGEFEGIGAEIGIRNGQLQVIAPLPDTPAEKAGLMAGDYILQINGTSTEGMMTEQAVMLIRGEKGTSVTLQIGRLVKAEVDEEGAVSGKKPDIKDVTIVRDTIVVKSVRLTWPKDNIAMIQVSNFNQDTDVEFKNAVTEVLSKNIKGLILDLRNNPGGYLDRSTAMAGEWTGKQVVVTERRKGKIVDEFRGTAGGRLNGVATVVLINQGSASASEIVAGALQDYGLAKIMGMTSYGKGSVQDYTEFNDGSAIKVTIAEWLTPKGRSINKSGIKPDFEVDRTIEDYNENLDPQLDKAIEYLIDPDVFVAHHATGTPQTP